jgi:hypothetical protein
MQPPARATAQEKSGVIGGPSRPRAIDGEGGLPRTVSRFPSSTLPSDGVAPPRYSGAPPLASGWRRGRRGGAERWELGARCRRCYYCHLHPPLSLPHSVFFSPVADREGIGGSQRRERCDGSAGGGARVRERQRCTARVDGWRMSRVGRALRCVSRGYGRNPPTVLP